MKTRAIVVTLLIGIMLSGCSLFRESLVEMSNEDVKNAKAVRKAALNFASTWEANSGFIRGTLGTGRFKEFPIQFGEAMDELDKMFIGEKDESGRFVEERVKIDKLPVFDLFYGLGLRVRTLETIIQETLKTYAPDVFDLIPFPLKF